MKNEALLSNCRTSLLATLLLFNFSLLRSEELRFTHLRTSDGLSQNSGLTLFQDSRGFLWIGTQTGLNRYDGHSVGIFQHEPTDSTSISDNYIIGSTEDSGGLLWTTVLGGGVNVFIRKSEQFLRLFYDPEKQDDVTTNRFNSILQDKEGSIWLGTMGGTLLHVPPNMNDPVDVRWTNAVRGARQISGSSLLCILEGSDERLWLGTSGGSVMSITRDDSGFQVASRISEGLTGTTVYSLVELSTMPGLIWIGTDQGLRLLDTRSEQIISWKYFIDPIESPEGETIRAMAEVDPGVLWIGTSEKGIVEFDLNTGQTAQFSHDPLQPSSLSGNTVISLLGDRSGVVWVGTLSGGVSKTVGKNYPFRFTGYDPTNPAGLRDDDVTAICEDRSGTLWIGTRNGGLHRETESASAKESEFYRYPIDPSTPTNLSDPYVKAIHEDSRGTLWVGVWAANGGLYKADERRKTFRAFQHTHGNRQSIGSNLVRCIRDDGDGTMWVGTTNGGLSRFSLHSVTAEGIRFSNFLNISSDPSSLSMDDVFSILVSSHSGSKEVWVSTYQGGINRLDPSTGNFSRYRFDPEDPQSLPDDRAWTILEDRNGNIWIGTYRGLAMLPAEHRDRGRFRLYTEEDGLTGGIAQGILEDLEGNIWISTQGGLSRYDPAARSFSSFSRGIDLPIQEFNLNSCFRSNSGELFFGGTNGFIRFRPEEVRINTTAPPIALTSFKIFEKPAFLDTAITEKRHVRLSYQQNFLSFSFAALDFRDPSRNRYSYRLEGLSDQWVNVGNRRYVSFSNLDPGEYVLHIRGSNNDGTWSEPGRSLAITITPPFWMTAWFRTTAVVLILLAIAGLVRLFLVRRLRRQLQELRVREQVQEERERISRDLHDHIGSNLTNLATGLEVSQRYINEGRPDELAEDLGQLERYTRSTIDALRETIWSVQREGDTFGSLRRKVEEFLDERFNATSTTLTRSFRGDDSLIVSPEHALNLYRICQEAVTNALRHSSAGIVTIEIEAGPKKISLKVSDNGKGFDHQKEGDHFGLSNMSRRASRMGSALKIASTPGKGTVIEIQVDR